MPQFYVRLAAAALCAVLATGAQAAPKTTFVQLGPGAPCLLCWEAFRPAGESLRAVTALNVEAVSVIGLAVQLALGKLRQEIKYRRDADQSEPD